MKRKIFISIFAMLLILVNITSTNANEIPNIAISVDKTNVKKGDEIQVTISGNGLKEKNVVGLMGTLEYDKSMLELVKDKNEESLASIETKNNWSTATLAINSSTFSTLNLNPTDGEMFTIKFKVLKNTGSTEIKIKNIVANDSNYQSVTNLSCNNVKIKGSMNYVYIVGIALLVLLIVLIFFIRKKIKSK